MILTVVPRGSDSRRPEIPVELIIAVPLVVPDDPLDLAELEGRVQA